VKTGTRHEAPPKGLADQPPAETAIKEKNMNKKVIGLALGALLVALSFPAEAQQPSKVPRIGFLSGGSPNTNTARDEAFRHGLQALGYIEGKNIVIDWRFAENNPDRYPGLAAELARLKVEVIVTAGSALTSAAKAATTTIPIVMGAGSRSCG
jgi:putative ABC transport system substrate-binding protein